MGDLGKLTEGSILDTKNITASIDNIKNTVSENTIKATESIKNVISNFNDKTVIIGLIIVILLALLVSYSLYYLVANNIFQEIKYIVPQTKVPVFANQKSIIPAVFPVTANGQNRTYTFWIYINDITKYNGSYKHVFHVGSGNDNVTTASPYIFLDSKENKMYVRFALTQGNTDSYSSGSSLQNIANISPVDLANYMIQGIVIPYIPLQRWVHVGIVVSTTSTGGTITCYVDGDLSISHTNGDVSDVPGATVNDNKLKLQNLVLDTSGIVTAGGSLLDPVGVGFSGLISKITTYNYALNQYDIYKDYNEGPIDSLMAKLGLGMYGVRSPIYQL